MVNAAVRKWVAACSHHCVLCVSLIRMSFAGAGCACGCCCVVVGCVVEMLPAPSYLSRRCTDGSEWVFLQSSCGAVACASSSWCGYWCCDDADVVWSLAAVDVWMMVASCCAAAAGRRRTSAEDGCRSTVDRAGSYGVFSGSPSMRSGIAVSLDEED